MKPWYISAVSHHPLDLRAAHPNVPERAVIERMHLAHRRVTGAAEGVGAPPFAGRGDDRLGKGANDRRSAARNSLQRAQDRAAEVMQRLGAGGQSAADQLLPHPLPLVRCQTPVINPIVEPNWSLGCLCFRIRSSIGPAAYEGPVA